MGPSLNFPLYIQLLTAHSLFSHNQTMHENNKVTLEPPLKLMYQSVYDGVRCKNTIYIYIYTQSINQVPPAQAPYMIDF